MVIITEFDCDDYGNSSDSSMAQALVPFVNNDQWQDQMDGISRNVFQQPEIGPHVFPYASTQEFQPCLATNGGYVRMEDTNAPQTPRVESPQPLPFEEFQRRLTQHLKDTVFQAVGELKQESQVQTKTQNTNGVITDAMPISFRVPGENDRKQRSKANLVAEIKKSFMLPSQLFAGHGVDLDKLPVPPPLLEQMKPLKPDVENKKQFTFFERLENWKLLCKQRVNGKFDTYYQHEPSEELFRSVVEVVNYMLYAICPRHLQKITKGTAMEDSSGTKNLKRNRSTCEISCGDPVPEEGIKTKSQLEEEVKAFLKDAYNNLLNLYSNKPQRIQ